MRAGVRPGLQILWVCLWWTGRFDSDTLPPASCRRDTSSLQVVAGELAERSYFVAGVFKQPLMSRRKTSKKLTKVKMAKLRARAYVGPVPATKRIEDRRRKPPKHKKREPESSVEVDR